MSTYEKSCKNYCSRFVDNLTDDKGIFQYRSEKKKIKIKINLSTLIRWHLQKLTKTLKFSGLTHPTSYS